MPPFLMPSCTSRTIMSTLSALCHILFLIYIPTFLFSQDYKCFCDYPAFMFSVFMCKLKMYTTTGGWNHFVNQFSVIFPLAVKVYTSLI